MKIGNFDLDKKVLIVAEIGNNHEGDFQLAKKMIKMAAKAGVDAVKFQKIIPDKLISIKKNDRIKQLKKYQLNEKEFLSLKEFANKQNVQFLSTPFDIKSAMFLNSIIPAYKVASSDINFYALIDYIAKTGKPIILSTGASEINEIKKSIEYIKKIWRNNNIHQEIALLHCVSCYPTSFDQINLRSIDFLREKISCTIGFSDHTIGIDAAIIAASRGARIIEKHFTIDKNYSSFRDHKLSADPQEMKELVEKVKKIDNILGNYSKHVMPCEKAIKKSLRRKIVADRYIPKGKLIDIKDIGWVRSEKGLDPGNEKLILGKKTKIDIEKGNPILKEMII